MSQGQRVLFARTDAASITARDQSIKPLLPSGTTQPDTCTNTHEITGLVPCSLSRPATAGASGPTLGEGKHWPYRPR